MGAFANAPVSIFSKDVHQIVAFLCPLLGMVVLPVRSF